MKTSPIKPKLEREVRYPICFVALAGLFLAAFLFSGCSWFDSRLPLPRKQPLSTLSEGQLAIFQNLASINSGLKSYKGVGKLVRNTPEGSQSARVAWMGAFPDSIRFEILDPAGRAILSISSDGRWLYVYDHNEKKFYQKRATAGTFQKIVSIPLVPQEIVALLVGRAPILTGDIYRLQVGPNTTDTEFQVAEPGNDQQWRILRMPGTDALRGFEIAEEEGRPFYRVSFSDYRIVDTFNIPMQVDITGPGNFGMKVHVERIWCNPPVENGIFRIEASRDAG